MASEIRVDKINSLSGVGTVTLSPTGVDIAGITTAATLKATTGIVTTLTATTGIVTTFEATTGDITTLRTPTGIATHFTADKISLPDSSDGSLCIGIGSDLKLNHNGTHSYITEVGGGDLYIQGSDIILRDAGTLEKHIEMTQNGAVDIYHNGTKKLETTSTGATLFGSLSIDANIIHNGDTDTMLSFSDANQVDIKCSDTVIGRFTTNGLAIGDNKRLDIFDASGHRSGTINNSDSGANSLRISADPDNSGSSTVIGFHIDGSEKAKVDSTGDLTISDGDLVIGTAGHGIDFSATGDASGATSELLDDYEEGSWTPDFQNRTSAAPNIQEGRYRKIGKQVFAYMHLNFNATLTVSGSGLLNIINLPFTSSSGHSVYGASSAIHMNNSFSVGTNEAFLNMLVPPNGTSANFYFNSGASNAHMPASRFGTGNLLTCIIYFTN